MANNRCHSPLFFYLCVYVCARALVRERRGLRVSTNLEKRMQCAAQCLCVCTNLERMRACGGSVCSSAVCCGCTANVHLSMTMYQSRGLVIGNVSNNEPFTAYIL